MGRRNTIAMQNIWNLCNYNSLDVKELKVKSELLLALYRDICWQICDRSKACEREAATFCSNDVDLGLMYLYEFAPTPTKREFTEKVYSIFHSRYLISRMDEALLRLKQYPKNGELYYNIIKMESYFRLPLLMIVVINMIQTIGIMYKLCICENDFLKSEFERVTAVKQIFVILFIIMVHLCNFIIIVYFYCNGKTEGFLLRNNLPVTELEDVIYYVIITYSTVGYGDIVPGCSNAQLFASIISVTSMLTTAVIIGKITGATISSAVTNKGMTKMSNSDVEKYLLEIKNIISNKGKIVVASRNNDYMAHNDMSSDTIKDIIINLKASDYEMSNIDLRQNNNNMVHIFLPEYKGKKLYLKIKVVGDNIYCMSLHEIKTQN